MLWWCQYWHVERCSAKLSLCSNWVNMLDQSMFHRFGVNTGHGHKWWGKKWCHAVGLIWSCVCCRYINVCWDGQLNILYQAHCSLLSLFLNNISTASSDRQLTWAYLGGFPGSNLPKWIRSCYKMRISCPKSMGTPEILTPPPKFFFNFLAISLPS